MVQEIKQYWDERANQFSSNPAATTDDIYLRELEIATIVQTLREIGVPKGGSILDVGCGNGYSTIKVAQHFSSIHFLGIDYSEKMINSAQKQRETDIKTNKNITFKVGDATSIGKSCGKSTFDVVLTDRCLINLGSVQEQDCAIAQIAEHISPGGYYIAIENFVEGHENMNKARIAIGLPEISVRWHNLYFKEKRFLASVKRFFEDISFRDFSSSYYFATRVIYSAMCHMQGENPNYNHEIHRLGVRLPWVGQFSPIRMAVMRRRD